MHTIIHRLNHDSFPSPATRAEYRSPLYDCTDLPQAMKLVLYVPGVDASGVDITTLGPDLFVTARKTQHVRANWSALHLESAQRDYQLKLRLGTGYDYTALRATLHRGTLTLLLPKKALAALPERARRVA